MNKKILFNSIVAIFLSFILASCTKTVVPGEYDINEVGKVKKVIPGMIVSKQPVNLHRNEDSSYGPSQGVEYVIKLNSGRIISVVQSEDLKLKPKQKILVIRGRHTRVVADNGQ
jgi:outer membrane lipoprotein SlyB